MIAYKRDEIISASDVARGFSNILNTIIDHNKEKFAISKNNKLEAVILDIEEYERLRMVYDLIEEEKIEQMLKDRTPQDKEISHSKTLTIEI